MGEDRDTAQDRVTIQEAGHRLGVKEDAIRKRIQRGSMRHEKADDGRVYVWVDTIQDADHSSQDAYQDTTQDDLLEDLREQIAYLRRQLAEERDARRRADMIFAQLSQANSEQARTIRVIEAPQEASEASEPGEEQQGRGVSPGPMPQARRRPYNGRGGGECSEDRRCMHNDQTTQDAQRLLAAMSTNHSEARMDTPYGLDRCFALYGATSLLPTCAALLRAPLDSYGRKFTSPTRVAELRYPEPRIEVEAPPRASTLRPQR